MTQPRRYGLGQAHNCVVVATRSVHWDASGVARLIRRNRVLLLMTLGGKYGCQDLYVVNCDAMVAFALRHVG